MLGLETPDAGTATFDGAAVRRRCRRRVRTVGAVLETAFHPARSGRNHLRVYCRAAGLPLEPRRRDARPGRAGRRRQPARRRLLPRHAPAARAGDGAARRPRRPRARRAGQRPRPRGHPVAARVHPAPGPRPGAHGARLQPPALRGRADRRPRGDHRRRAGWSARARWPSSGRGPTAPARCSSAAPRPPGSPTSCAPTARCVTADGDALTVTGRTPAEVGTRAFAAGIELHELRAESSGLEEIYFRLTAGQEQFAAPQHVAGVPTTPEGPDDPPGARPSGPSCSPPGCGSACCSAPARWSAAFAALFTGFAGSEQNGQPGLPAGRHASSTSSSSSPSPPTRSVMLLILGIIGMTQEYRHRTATPTFLTTPRRGNGRRRQAARLRTGRDPVRPGHRRGRTSSWPSVYAGARGDAPAFTADNLRVLAGAGVALVIFAVMGVGIGALLRNQVGAIVGALVYLYVVEPIISSIPATAGAFKWLPGGATQAMTRQLRGPGHPRTLAGRPRAARLRSGRRGPGHLPGRAPRHRLSSSEATAVAGEPAPADSGPSRRGTAA